MLRSDICPFSYLQFSNNLSGNTHYNYVLWYIFCDEKGVPEMLPCLFNPQLKNCTGTNQNNNFNMDRKIYLLHIILWHYCYHLSSKQEYWQMHYLQQPCCQYYVCNSKICFTEDCRIIFSLTNRKQNWVMAYFTLFSFWITIIC